MIMFPQNPTDWDAMAAFLRDKAGVHPSLDLRMIGWVSEKELRVVVGLNGWLGKTVQAHIAMADGFNFAPRAMLKEVFRYIFHDAKKELVIGILNSKNEEALKFDLHIGFEEIFRLPGMHENGGDIIVLGMRKDQCRYLKSFESPVVGHA